MFSSALKQGIATILFNIVLDMVNIKLEVFSKQGPGMIRTYRDDIEIEGSSTNKKKGNIYKNSYKKKVGPTPTKRKENICTTTTEQVATK